MSQERDLREYAKSTQRRLFFGVILLLFMIGDGLIYILYGDEAGKLALICTALGLSPLILIFAFLWLFGRLARSRLDE